MNFIVSAKWATKTVVMPSYLLCNVYDTSHKMGKWFAPNAARRSYIFRGNQKTNHPIVIFVYQTQQESPPNPDT